MLQETKLNRFKLRLQRPLAPFLRSVVTPADLRLMEHEAQRLRRPHPYFSMGLEYQAGPGLAAARGPAWSETL